MNFRYILDIDLLKKTCVFLQKKKKYEEMFALGVTLYLMYLEVAPEILGCSLLPAAFWLISTPFTSDASAVWAVGVQRAPWGWGWGWGWPEEALGGGQWAHRGCDLEEPL